MRRLPEPSRSTAISSVRSRSQHGAGRHPGLDNSSTEQGIDASSGSGTISADIVVQGSQPEEDWVLTSAYTFTIAADVDFTGYNSSTIGGNTVFDGASYTGDTFAVMGYTVRRTTDPGNATFNSGNLTTTVETAAGYDVTGTIDWNSPGTLTPVAMLAVGDGSSGCFSQTAGTVDTAAPGRHA